MDALRRINLLIRGFFLFKDWDIWLAQRLHRSKRRGPGTFRFRNGITFQFDYSRDDTGIFQEIWLKDIYEKFYKIQKGDVVIDIGAHIGTFSVFAASKGATVYAYEPTPKTFALLEQNAKGHSVHPFNLAVSDTVKEITIYEVEGGSSGNSTHAIAQNQSSFTAKTTTLADIFESNRLTHCDLLKMDCEGAETDIIRAAPKALFEKIPHIAMEYHGNLPEVTRLLEEKGCRILGTSGNSSLGFLYAEGPEA